MTLSLVPSVLPLILLPILIRWFCFPQVKDGAQHDTQFVITSTQASRLPVVDFATYDLAGELEVEIGEVCFWWTVYNN